MLFATWVTALNILVFAALMAAVIYLFVLIVRALKKYIGSKEMLEDALERFDGTIIMVSHDRYLLNRIPTKIIEMSADGYETYNGRYDYYLEHKIEPQVKKVEVSEEKKQASQSSTRPRLTVQNRQRSENASPSWKRPSRKTKRPSRS